MIYRVTRYEWMKMTPYKGFVQSSFVNGGASCFGTLG